MNGTTRTKMRAAIACIGLIAAAAMPAARAADAEDVAEGMRLFMQKGNCQQCHGWAGDGRKMDNQAPDGANLRESKLDRKAFVMIVKCGLPNTGMPPFDRLAYSDGRCYGKKQSELKAAGIKLADPPATLQPREVELLADFVFAKVAGQGPMTKAKCTEYWGSAAEVCNDVK